MTQPSTDTGNRSLVGRRLGDYQLLRRLGRGGMAEVYLAEQCSLGRKVAVKILREDLARDASYIQRFQNEARAAAALVHANVVQVYEVGCCDGHYFIAQEYVAGQTLKQWVTRHGALSVPQTVSVLRQIAAALDKAAQQHIVHRDIKPENILLTPAGDAKVADFGLARVINRPSMELTQAGITMGTPLYMSPEQLEGRPLDGRSDIYSCGVTAYFMLAGRPPFEADNPLAIAVLHLRQPPPDLKALRSDIPDKLAAIIAKMLAKEPADRFISAAELLNDLRALPTDGAEPALTDIDRPPFPQPELDSGPCDVTAHLQAALDTTIAHRRARSRAAGPLVRWSLLLFAGALLGILAGWLTWQGPLLERGQIAGSIKVERKATVEAQFIYAVAKKSEEAWQAVAEYFPPEENSEENSTNWYYAQRAKQQLALLLLENEQYDRAYALFSELASLPDSEEELRAIGMAGQAIVHARRGQTELMAEKISDVLPLREKLERGMREEIERLTRQLPASSG